MIQLRPYQLQAVEAVFREWESVRSTLYVAATGVGKTSIFAEIISRLQPKRSLVIAHREELIFQAANRIREQVDIDCEIEMADMIASNSAHFQAPVVVATVQTLNSPRRLQRFNPNDFDALVVDECHHGTADSYRRVINHFSSNDRLRIVGCTATPDRADEEALGQVFETVAHVYEILDAIHDGWLVPIDQQMVSIEGLDFSQVRTTAGDLNTADLSSVMEKEKNLQGVCGAAIQIIGDKRSLVFTSSVKHAEMACEIFNRYSSGMAGWVCGKTDKQERRDTMKAFANGRLQVLCNVGCLTEGVDVPAAEVVIMARPTKSRSLYAQMAGRILRPLSGLVDPLESADARKEAIARSVKPSALIVDFVGNSGRHKLMTAVDILGGNTSDQAIAEAIEIAKQTGRPERIDQLIEEAEMELRRQEALERREKEAARRLRLTAKVSYHARQVDPFAAFDLTPVRTRGWDEGKSVTEKQRALLLKQGIDPDALPYAQAKQVLNTLFYRWKNGLSTVKQCATLKRFGYDPTNMTKKEASAVLDTLAKNNWRKPSLDMSEIGSGFGR